MNPTLLDLPVPITTPRLIIAPPKKGDGRELNEAVVESHNELRVWESWARFLPSINQSEEIVRKCMANWILKTDKAVGLVFFIREKTENKFVGAIALHNIDWNLPRTEVGYWLRTSCLNQGYATEALNAITKYSFYVLNVRRIEIKIDSANTRSIKVPQRLGYRLEALQKSNHVMVNGDISDVVVYVRNDPLNLPQLEVNW